MNQPVVILSLNKLQIDLGKEDNYWFSKKTKKRVRGYIYWPVRG